MKMKHLFCYISTLYIILTSTCIAQTSIQSRTAVPPTQTGIFVTSDSSAVATSTILTPEFNETEKSTHPSLSNTTVTSNTEESETTTTTPSPTESTTTAVGVCTPSYCTDKSKYCVIDENKPTCKCNLGYVEKEKNGFCETAKTFGGKLATDLNNRRRRDVITNLEHVTTLLNSAYDDTIGYVTVDVAEEPDTGNWPYTLFYEINSNITEDGIKDALSLYLDSENCTADDCTINGLKINKDESVINAGSYSEAVCKSYPDYCDKESTTCKSSGGFSKCECNDGYVAELGNDQFCQAKLCDGDSKCNYPFGTCDISAKNNIGECSCIFGFNGKLCEDPWLFIFVVVISAIALFSLIALITCAVKKSNNKKAKPKKTQYKADYPNYAYVMDINHQNHKPAKNTKATARSGVDYSAY